jgi:hypothetical protein
VEDLVWKNHDRDRTSHEDQEAVQGRSSVGVGTINGSMQNVGKLFRLEELGTTDGRCVCGSNCWGLLIAFRSRKLIGGAGRVRFSTLWQRPGVRLLRRKSTRVQRGFHVCPGGRRDSLRQSLPLGHGLLPRLENDLRHR